MGKEGDPAGALTSRSVFGGRLQQKTRSTNTVKRSTKGMLMLSHNSRASSSTESVQLEVLLLLSAMSWAAAAAAFSVDGFVPFKVVPLEPVRRDPEPAADMVSFSISDGTSPISQFGPVGRPLSTRSKDAVPRRGVQRSTEPPDGQLERQVLDR
uniref:Uncharacterized protein n=1 Tax=Peronospora matthiolae TaxID=2874970 RepID=A0AAV1U599_9STRA